MKHQWTRRLLPRLLVLLSTALVSVAVFQTQTHQPDPVPLKVVPELVLAPEKPKVEDPEPFVDYEETDKLFLNGYEVSKVEARVPYEMSDDEHGRSITEMIDSTYVVVKKDGKTIAKFDGIESPLGNGADFGLFDLLGNGSKEVIISLTISRGGSHWVVSLDPQFRVLFDDRDYNIGRETLSIVDVDKDGVQEIALPIVSYYGMEGLESVSETPLPEIIFKYDAKQKKYLPANHLFVDYVFRGRTPENEKETYQHHRFDVLFNYIYAGREVEGWASFDKYYPSPDKEVMVSRIKGMLKNDPVYKYIYKDRKN